MKLEPGSRKIVIFLKETCYQNLIVSNDLLFFRDGQPKSEVESDLEGYLQVNLYL